MLCKSVKLRVKWKRIFTGRGISFSTFSLPTENINLVGTWLVHKSRQGSGVLWRYSESGQ